LEALTCLLDRLERQVWWWKVVGSSAIGILGCVVLIGATAQTAPGEIKTNRVVIVDDAGKPRIVLGKGQDRKGELSDNTYVVSLADGKGITTAVLYVYDFSDVATESGLDLRDIKGKTRVDLRPGKIRSASDAG
jgi:hypothetical protein